MLDKKLYSVILYKKIKRIEFNLKFFLYHYWSWESIIFPPKMYLSFSNFKMNTNVGVNNLAVFIPHLNRTVRLVEPGGNTHSEVCRYFIKLDDDDLRGYVFCTCLGCKQPLIKQGMFKLTTTQWIIYINQFFYWIYCLCCLKLNFLFASKNNN